MSIIEKSMERLKSIPRDYKWEELFPIMRRFDYAYQKAEGSRRKFKHSCDEKFDIDLHEPHRNRPMKKYALEIIVEKLKQAGKI